MQQKQSLGREISFVMQWSLIFQNQGPIDEMPGPKTSKWFHVAVHNSLAQQQGHSVHCSYKIVHYLIFLPAR
jgi:hypothetical protein